MTSDCALTCIKDCYGVAARERYMLDYMRVPLSDSVAPLLTAESFDDVYPHYAVPLIFDSLYTYVVAINNLLHAGFAPQQIHGELLLEELKATSFIGVSGQVSFDEVGDRIGRFDLMNTVVEGELLPVAVAYFDAATDGHEQQQQQQQQ
eukprot:2599512-Amphidinium_carterae.1